MNVPFSPAETEAINQMAKVSDISPEALVVQAVRMYQLWKMNRIRLIWPRILEHKLVDAEPTSIEPVYG